MFLRHQVVTVHDMMQLDHPQYFSRAFAKWYGFLVPRVIRISRKVLTMSEYVKARVLHYVPEAAGKIKVIALGASKAFRPYNAGEIAAARQQVAIPSARYLVSVASLVSHKNLRRVLEAWGRVVDQIAPDVYLVLVGSVGPRRIFQVPELGALPARVVCVGHLDDKLLAPVVAGAMALVYVSLHEGFGLPPLEAMSAGVPCIVSNTTALPEVVGDAALTVDPCSTAEVAAGMQRVLEDEGLRRELSGRSRERAAQFSWETTATLTFETLRECA
jgi:glycosyltransferase involved in cell wall biosynthesis